MTKADIVNEISKSTGIDKANVLETIEKFMETVKESLSHGENVYLRGFGSFITKVRSEKDSPQHFQKHHHYHPRTPHPRFQARKGVHGRGKGSEIIKTIV